MNTGERDWHCVAYGPAGPPACFLAATGACGDRAECETRMAEEKKRVYRRIQELAAAGHGTGQALAEEFPTPAEVLYPDEEG